MFQQDYSTFESGPSNEKGLLNSTASGRTSLLLCTVGTDKTQQQSNNTVGQEKRYLRVAGAIEELLKFETSTAFNHLSPKRALNRDLPFSQDLLIKIKIT